MDKLPALPGNWPEDASHENGDYECRCCHCGATFYGHKRRVTCKVCARSELPALPNVDPIEQMRTAYDVAREHDSMIPRMWVLGWAEQWEAERQLRAYGLACAGVWRPISEAPRDRPILLCGGKWWSDNAGLGCDEFPLTRPVIGSWRKNAWHIGNGEAYNDEWWAEPTHWQPLPYFGHDSDCAMHNAPAYPTGACDCALSHRRAESEKG